MEKVRKLLFPQIKRKLPHLCCDTILGYFWPQGAAQCVHHYRIRENRKWLGLPPPLKTIMKCSDYAALQVNAILDEKSF